MPFRVAVHGTEPCLEVRAEGPAQLKQLRALVSFVGELCGQEPNCKLLADLSGVQPDLSFTDHLHFAMAVSSLLRHVQVLAAVVPPGYLDAPAAKAAKLAGINLKTFLERDAAMHWLEASAAQAA